MELIGFILCLEFASQLQHFYYTNCYGLTKCEAFEECERQILYYAERPWGYKGGKDEVKYTPFTGREDWFAVSACVVTALIICFV